MEKLLKLAQNPEPFEPGTQEIWLDPDRSDYVLKAYFDENIPGGSRSDKFIEETIEFITKIAPIEEYKKIVDLGCGPGRYSNKLAMKGYDVVGVDFNNKSLEYAIEEAKRSNLSVNYRKEDITDIKLENEFDMALLIYQIYSVFSAEDRKKILSNIHQGLRPGGLVLLDVLSIDGYNKFEQNLMWFLSRKDSPLSDKKHLTLAAALKYPNNVTLARNVLIFGDGNLVNYNYWNQHFSLESLEKEVREAGFTIENVYGDVNGREYVAEEESFAVVLKKK